MGGIGKRSDILGGLEIRDEFKQGKTSLFMRNWNKLCMRGSLVDVSIYIPRELGASVIDDTQ